jgi:hypothetical protein
LVLPTEKVTGWEKQWGAKVTKFEMDGGAGQIMTDKEQAAAKDGADAMTQDDPAPQTVFRLAAKPDATVLVTVRLPFRKDQASRSRGRRSRHTPQNYSDSAWR